MFWNLVVLAGVAGAAYWWGSRSRGTPARPLPPIPPPLPPREAATMPEYAAQWAALPFGFSVAPKGAGRLLYAFPPPAGPAEITVAPDCSLLAVGELWWDRAGDTAKQWADQGHPPGAIIDAVIAELAPPCVGASSAAALELRAELRRRMSRLGTSPGPAPPRTLRRRS